MSDLVKVTIDGKTVEVPRDHTILQAAEVAGVDIPTMCFDPRIKPFGACRMCLVQVEGGRGLATACTHPVMPDMVVTTQTEQIAANRKTLLELLLTYHPLDCPTCDKGGECTLQNLSFAHGPQTSRLEAPKHHYTVDDRSPLIQIDNNLCVLCEKCVRMCDEVIDVAALAMSYRGYHTKVVPSFGKVLDCEYCGACVSVCPVGALGDKLYKYRSRPWDQAKKESICTYCGVGCHLKYGVANDEVLRVTTSPDLGHNQGLLCTRGSYGWGYIESEQRIRQPLIKKNGTFQTATWSEALDWVAEKLQRVKSDHGANAVAAVGSGGMTMEEAFLLRKAVREGLGSAHLDCIGGSQSAAALDGIEAVIGVRSNATIRGAAAIEQADLVFIARAVISETQPVAGYVVSHLVHRNEGSNLVLVDGREEKFSRYSTPHARVRPGTETAFVYGVINALIQGGLVDCEAAAERGEGFEALAGSVARFTPEHVAQVCGIPAEQVGEAAAKVAGANNAVFITAVESAVGGQNREIAEALALLALVSGHFKEGSGLLVMQERANSVGVLAAGLRPAVEGLDAAGIAAHLGSQIKGLLVVGEDLTVTLPAGGKVAAALNDLDFLVVCDHFMTATAQAADVVLPLASTAESDGTFINQGGLVQSFQAAISPKEAAKPGWQILYNLARRLGGIGEIGGFAELQSQVKAAVPAMAGRATNLFAEAAPKGSYRAVAFDAAPPSSGLVLTTGSIRQHNGTLSTHAEGPMRLVRHGFVEVHPDDALRLELDNGDRIQVRTTHGVFEAEVEVNDRGVAGYLFVPRHFVDTPVLQAMPADGSLPAAELVVVARAQSAEPVAVDA
ncbi:MAG: hypothetical protein COX57_06090 [Alphaproteobacteria bacterium CG_4_10_14_0_2_um_filter_63_37]|nr:MAG: hypothetical protein AUJ55_01570 [Proteobacteria bacterium CG1_02_64_396]PJA24884.1 MAG: hypothetical protein COX57_06090 [Alphaproteobacteria bacterium CG_4_10_14_0_2_um_filter_63_37]